MAIAIAGIFGGTAQSIYVPRLLSSSGKVLSAGIRRMAGLSLLALGVFGVFAAIAPMLSSVIAPTLDRPGVHLVALMHYAAIFGFCQVIVGQLVTLSWARGGRFIPATTSALPSIVAAVPLLLLGHVSTLNLYALLTAGSLLQVLLLAVTSTRGLRLTAEPLGKVGGLTSAWLGAYAIQQFVVPFEVLIAAHASTGGGAEFNYAYRGLSVAQLLIVGGVAYAALPDWSDYARTNARAALERSIARAISLTGLALSLAAAIGLVASQPLVQLAFQHGSFTAHDTHVVSAILTVALVGFVAEGVMLVLSPALVADRRTSAAITVGMVRTAAVIVLVSIFGLTKGLVGVAIGYSAANVLALTVLLFYVVRAGMLTRRQTQLARSSGLVAVFTIAAAGVLLILDAPPLARATVVLAVFATATVGLRQGLPRIRVPA
ncbi:MAG: lipid II flippase MurJ [Solirubrobacteraceae bacterium]